MILRCSRNPLRRSPRRSQSFEFPFRNRMKWFGCTTLFPLEKHLRVQANKERHFMGGYSKLATKECTGTLICDFSVSLGLIENPTGLLRVGQNVRKQPRRPHLSLSLKSDSQGARGQLWPYSCHKPNCRRPLSSTFCIPWEHIIPHTVTWCSKAWKKKRLKCLWGTS